MSLITQGLGADEAYEPPDPDVGYYVPPVYKEPTPPIGGYQTILANKEPVPPENGQFG